MDVSVILPTYREAENLPLLVPRMTPALETTGLRGQILIVDVATRAIESFHVTDSTSPRTGWLCKGSRVLTLSA